MNKDFEENKKAIKESDDRRKDLLTLKDDLTSQQEDIKRLL